jgi:hypothetical protein
MQMGLFSSLFCKHEWDGAWQHNGHECTLCGYVEAHQWVPVEDAPLTDGADAQPDVFDWGDGARAAPRSPATLFRVYKCAVCGATRMR